MQKLGDIKSVIVQFEDPEINVNFLDAVQSIHDKIMTREVFMALPQVVIEQQAPGATGYVPQI